jgi:predicted acyltransferase
MAMNCFAVCYWLVDVQGWRKWAKPFAIYGMNAIAAFMLAGLSGRIMVVVKVTNAGGEKVGLQAYLYEKLCAPFASPETAPFFGFLASRNNASLMWALMYVEALYLIVYLMYRRKWFLKL